MLNWLQKWNLKLQYEGVCQDLKFTVVCSGLQKDRYHGTSGTKEGLTSIGSSRKK